MTDKEKVKAYDEALERAKNVLLDCTKEERNVVEYLHPELKESGDKKTKRVLHSIANKMSQHLRDIFSEEEFQCYDAWSNAWLKKQGEQKPTVEMKTPEESLGVGSDTYNKIVDECVFGEQKTAWSEEDESMFRRAIITIDNVRMGTDSQEYYQGICDWLKSLKDRYTWKPSKEQINGIECAIKTLQHQLNVGDKRLNSLYNDLKKLRGE